MMLGEVDRVGTHYIATNFIALCIPTGSMYVTKTDYSRSGNVSRMSWQGVNIPLDWRSALIAYPRVWLWFLALAWPFLTHWGENVSNTPRSVWYTSLAMIVFAILAHFPGRLSKAEKARLQTLGEATGLRIDPKRLSPLTRMQVRDDLEPKLRDASLPVTADGIRTASPSLPRELRAQLYAFALYSAVDARKEKDAEQAAAWQAAADALATDLFRA